MHTVAIRRDVYEANPWIAQSLTKAFVQAKQRVYENLYTTSALTTMLPWQVAQVEEVRRDMSYLMVSTETPVETLVSNYLRKRGLVR